VRNPFMTRERLARSSVKESFDNLPMGMCFANPHGFVLLLNRRMSGLSHAVTGSALQDAEAFWTAVTEGAPAPGAERIRYGTAPVIRLPDGTAWAFSRHVLTLEGKPVTQLVASDVTELDDARLKLCEANAKLKVMNDRLKQYGKDLIEVTAREERLDTKVRIHDELGRALLATRRCLGENEGDEAAAPILELWRRDISALRGSAEAKPRTTMTVLADAARTLGVSLRVEGELPAEKGAETLLLSAVSEALNNAVRHAGAKSLTVVLSRSPGAVCAGITNDGAPPEGEIAEGGGLTALRRVLEANGGTLEISSAPVFKMTVTLPLSEEVASR